MTNQFFRSLKVSQKGGCPGGLNVGYSYDAENGVTNYFILDYKAPLKMPLAEADALGNITRYYVWSSHGLLAHLDMNPTNGVVVATRYYHADEQGSTLALTDAAGTVTDQFAYSPYGQLLGHTGTNSIVFGWLGSYGVYFDASANLHLTLHRAYSAEQHRWLSTDPMGIDGGANLYAYGNLNPLSFVDPDGLLAKGTGIGLKDLVGGAAKLWWDIGGSLGYGAVSIFDYELAERIYGSQAAGLRNSAYGMARLVWDAGGGIGYGLSYYGVSPEYASRIYGAQWNGLQDAGTALSGGEGRSAAFRTGYVGSQLAAIYFTGKYGNEPINLRSAGTTAQTSFYVTPDGTAIPATGYRAIGGPAVARAAAGDIMSQSGPTYLTFDDLSGLSGSQAQNVLQQKYTPSHYATFDTLQLVDGLSIPGAKWNTMSIPEPIDFIFSRTR